MAVWALVISILTLIVAILVNVAMACFWSGKITAILDSVREQFATFRQMTNHNFDRVERKQDNINSFVERITIVEQSAKSCHHRQDELCIRLSELERKVNNAKNYNTLDSRNK